MKSLAAAVVFSIVLTPWYAQSSNIGISQDSAQASDPAPSPASDDQAIGLITSALKEMGGTDALLSVTSSAGAGTQLPSGQSLGQGGSFSFATSGKEYRYESSAKVGSEVLVSGFGKPTLTVNGTDKRSVPYPLDPSWNSKSRTCAAFSFAASS